MVTNMNKFVIVDWAGNEITLKVNEKLKSEWNTFDDAETDLANFLQEDYDESRQEYEIVTEREK